jgi:hypothetical protein
MLHAMNFSPRPIHHRRRYPGLKPSVLTTQRPSCRQITASLILEHKVEHPNTRSQPSLNAATHQHYAIETCTAAAGKESQRQQPARLIGRLQYLRPHCPDVCGRPDELAMKGASARALAWMSQTLLPMSTRTGPKSSKSSSAYELSLWMCS